MLHPRYAHCRCRTRIFRLGLAFLLAVGVRGAEVVSAVRVRAGVPRLIVHGREVPPLLFFTSPPASGVRFARGQVILERRRGEITVFAPGPARSAAVTAEAEVVMEQGFVDDATAQVRVCWNRRTDAAYILGLQFTHAVRRVKLWKKNRAGKWETWFTVPWPWEIGRSVRLRIVVRPGHVAGYVNGRLVAERDDPTPLPPGNVGLGAYCCRARFAGVRVRAGGRPWLRGFPQTATGLPTPWRCGDSTPRLQAFARAGVRLFTWALPMDRWWIGPGEINPGDVEAEIAAMARAVPGGMVLLRVSVNPPLWWIEKHPEERMVLRTLDGRQWQARWAAMGSQLWRREAGRALEEFVRRLAAGPMGGHILGWHIAAGDCGEWSYAWTEAYADYAPAQQRAFRAWLRDKYGTDAALQKAWHRQGVLLKTATVPSPERRRRASLGELRDPRREQDVIDYLRFHSETCAGALCHFCTLAKKACRARYITGAFYGYWVTAGWRPASWYDAGHRALQRVLDCPAVDFICDPYDYRDRGPGAPWTSQAPAAAIRAAGKLPISEDDTRTFLTPDNAAHAFGRCPDRAATIGVLERNWAAVVTRGGGLWWMEQGPGWFDDKAVLEAIRNMTRLTARLPAAARTSAAEIAVIIDEHSAAATAHTSNLILPFLIDQIAGELGRCGAPYDVLLASQVQACRPYTLYLLPFVCSPSEKVRVQLRRLYTPGRTFLWLHAPGLITAAGPSAEAASRLTGLRFELRRIGGPVHVTLLPAALERWPPLSPGLRYGTLRRVAPILEVADPAAQILGIGRATALNVQDGCSWPRPCWQGVGLAAKRVDGATVLFSCTASVPAELLREIARKAGVHIWNEQGDFVSASRSMAALHAAYSGRHVLNLPGAFAVRDAFTGKPIGQNITRISCNLSMGRTRVWLLEPPLERTRTPHRSRRSAGDAEP